MLALSRLILLFHIILLLQLELIAAQHGNPCTTAISESGICVEYTKCQYIYNMMHESDISSSNVNYIRNSQCGYEEGIPWVCCSFNHLSRTTPSTTHPKTSLAASTTPPTISHNVPTLPRNRPTTRADALCKTRFGEDYACIALQDCPTLFNISKQLPMTSENQNLLRRSQCAFTKGKTLVCCQTVVDLLPDPTKCGIASIPRIFGGRTVKQGEFPWLALIVYTTYTGNKEFRCGGSLINSRYVLTAAHCVGSNTPAGLRVTHVRLGEWDLDVNPDCTSENDRNCWQYTDVEIEETIVHPQYSSMNSQMDIALLRLSKTVEYNDYVKPICLPKTSNLYNNLFTNENMTVAGWGNTEYNTMSRKPLQADLTIMELENCNRAYSRFNKNIIGTQMCADGNGVADTCDGDSGGPLMRIEKIDYVDVFFLTGLTSFGPSYCAIKGLPGVYTRIGAYMDWIRSNIRP